MAWGRSIALVLATALLAACSPGIAQLNARPTKHYQETVSFKGRVSRMQELPGEVLLEIADDYEHRIFVRAAAPVDVAPEDWVEVSGILVPEARVGGRVVYDIIQAESVSKTRAPMLRGLF
jgi:hypothetical protein